MPHLILFLALSGFGLAVQAQAFKWIDSKGQVQYGDQPPADGRVWRVESMQTEPAPGVSEATGARLRTEERALLQELESENSINESQVLVETEQRVRSRCAKLEKSALQAKRQVYFSSDSEREVVTEEYQAVRRAEQQACGDIEGLVRKRMCAYFSGLTPPFGQRALEMIEQGKDKYCEPE
jgi:hypothetical protein